MFLKDWTLYFRHQSTYPPLTKHKNHYTPGSVRSRLARHPPRFLTNVPEHNRLELLKDAKTKSCSSCYSKTHTQPPESLMVVLSKRKLTKQIQKRRWQKKHYSCVSFISFSGTRNKQLVAGGRVSKCNFAAIDFGFPLPGTVVWVPCFIAPCCLSVCFSLAPAPSPPTSGGGPDTLLSITEAAGRRSV
jgi:hypothetical protein